MVPNNPNLRSQGVCSSATYGDSLRASQGRLPKLNFLVFLGEDLQLWRSRCESYFEMYAMEPPLWIKVALMHLEGVAARWLQSVAHKIRTMTWEEFCVMVHDRFGRDQHEALIWQLFHIRQIGLAAEYVEKFSVLVDQFLAYEVEPNPIYDAMRFVDGLTEDIKSIVMIHHPATLDTACALALV
jgi:hypothetical protein